MTQTRQLILSFDPQNGASPTSTLEFRKEELGTKNLLQTTISNPISVDHKHVRYFGIF